MNEACQRYEWVMSHIWMRHVRDMNESCHTYEWGMSEICHTYEWFMSHIRLRHITHTNALYNPYEWVMSHIHEWVLPYTCTESHMNATYHTREWGAWHIRMCDMTHSYLWHASFICVTWLIHISDMPHSYVWHDSFISLTCLIHMCDMTHSYLWHASFICVTWLIYISHIRMSRMTRCETCHTYEWGWRHTRMRHITHMKASYQQREKEKPSLQWAMTRMNEAYGTYKCDTSHTWMRDISRERRWSLPFNETWRIRMRVVTHVNSTHHTDKCVIPAEREGEAFTSISQGLRTSSIIIS